MDVIIVREESPEIIRQRVLFAKALGHGEVLVLFSKHAQKNMALLPKEAELKVLTGIMVRDRNQARSLRQYDARVAPAKRELIEEKAVTHILNPESGTRPDFIHHRNSGLNQVLLKICKRQGKSVLTCLTQLWGRQPEIMLGRMMQNARWCKKYKVPYHLVSGSRTKYEQRSDEDLKAFQRVLIGS